jgi:hypothetical protein
MKIHHTQYRKNYVKYILNENEITPTELKERFYGEYGHQIARQGKLYACAEWLQGLALSIPFYNDDIVAFAVEMGSLDEYYTSKEEKAVINGYWFFMAERTLEAMEVK